MFTNQYDDKFDASHFKSIINIFLVSGDTSVCKTCYKIVSLTSLKKENKKIATCNSSVPTCVFCHSNF